MIVTMLPMNGNNVSNTNDVVVNLTVNDNNNYH